MWILTSNTEVILRPARWQGIMVQGSSMVEHKICAWGPGSLGGIRMDEKPKFLLALWKSVVLIRHSGVPPVFIGLSVSSEDEEPVWTFLPRHPEVMVNKPQAYFCWPLTWVLMREYVHTLAFHVHRCFVYTNHFCSLNWQCFVRVLVSEGHFVPGGSIWIKCTEGVGMGGHPWGQEAEEESCQEPGLSSLTDYAKLVSIQKEIEQRFTLKWGLFLNHPWLLVSTQRCHGDSLKNTARVKTHHLLSTNKQWPFGKFQVVSVRR